MNKVTSQEVYLNSINDDRRTSTDLRSCDDGKCKAMATEHRIKHRLLQGFSFHLN